jgi:hypothetical protein
MEGFLRIAARAGLFPTQWGVWDILERTRLRPCLLGHLLRQRAAYQVRPCLGLFAGA